jgi:acetyl esterase/lipase
MIGGMVLAVTATGKVRAAEQEVLPLWPGKPPGDRPGLFDFAASPPSLTVLRPANPSGAAMLVVAGGGYRRIQIAKEANPAAAWLVARGVTAFVLQYRLPAGGWYAAGPLQDGQRAMRLIAAQPGIDRSRIGALGFSSGGHLTGLMAAKAGKALYEPVDAVDGHSARPAVVGLIYPVISLLPPNNHTSTYRQMTGGDPEAAAALSVERQVTAEMPPVFLAHAMDDPIAPVANTQLMQAACRAAGVTVEAHLFKTGGHGWAMGQGETAQWPDLFATWLTKQGFL